MVASEIRKLAEQSERATEEIKIILSRIQEESNKSVMQIEDGKKAVSNAVGLAETSVSGFEQMNMAVNQMVSIVESLDESVKQIELRTQKISAEMSNISAVTEETVASVEELYSVTETHIGAAQHVNQELRRLKELSKSLQEQF